MTETSKLLFVLFGLINIPQLAFASGYISSGSRTATTDGLVTVEDGDDFLIYFEANRSYACGLIPQNSNGDLGLNSTFTITDSSNPFNPVTTSYPARACGNITPVITADNNYSDNRRCFIAELSDKHKLTASNSLSNDKTARLECLETTLYGGFNTFPAGGFNYVTLINTTNATISGTITARSYSGTILLDKQAYSIIQDRRLDIQITTAVGVSEYGSLRITHNGPHGALQGWVNHYQPDTKGGGGNLIFRETTPLQTREHSY